MLNDFDLIKFSTYGVWILFLLFIFVSSNSFAELPSTKVTELNGAVSKLTIGTELDALPYITGGYYLSIIGGFDRFRLRAIVSQVNLPSFAYNSSKFSKSNLQVYALVLDYFFAPKYNGYWIGGGFENWAGKVKEKGSGTSGTYQEWISTIGAGYNRFFYQNFYLNPWIAVHARIAGDSQTKAGNQIYSISNFQGEGSLKIGWYF